MVDKQIRCVDTQINLVDKLIQMLKIALFLKINDEEEEPGLYLKQGVDKEENSVDKHLNLVDKQIGYVDTQFNLVDKLIQV